MKQLRIALSADSRADFTNNAAFCVGTGRMGLALHQAYQEQLALAKELAGFQYIRGHGLFCDDMAIYQPYTDARGVSHEAYNFTYLDRVMDSYLKLGIRPFLELGFMPEKMASGTQTIFYWKGNVTPPSDMDKWTAMVKATLAHLRDRYGYDEVCRWPCEVWNEPNLVNFWENADKAKYLELYAATAKAVKEVLPDMRVGGPAICGGEGSQQWVDDFLRFCRDNQLPLDFVTRHAYMGQQTTKTGRYTYHAMCAVEDTYQEMKRTREIIDSYPEYRGMEMHITEFNTSYNPLCPIHDTNLNAAYIAGLLACLGDVAASYSYWTFGDVFEESGVPTRPFHGGFGMIAGGLIVKPTMWTFAFFNCLKGTPVYRDEHAVIACNADGSYEGVLWNLCREDKRDLCVSMEMPDGGAHTLLTRIVDEDCCNPLKVWHDMGEPASLSREELEFLRVAAQPVCQSRLLKEGEPVQMTLGRNAVMHFKLRPYRPAHEYGYDYEWYNNL
ncbi:MAG: xylan 1,4-beta-xylosidase [Clostridiales bacterium]|nr:xylan 1,4-beta-xylosidase [Clostridiales bacterium]